MAKKDFFEKAAEGVKTVNAEHKNTGFKKATAKVTVNFMEEFNARNMFGNKNTFEK